MKALERPTKGQRTRRRIVERAAVLFNTRGVAGTAMADISEASGLEKGGVYNHFATKEELAIEAFEYAAALIRERFAAAMAVATGSRAKLGAMLDVYRASHKPVIAGGCPLMNTAIEADDTDPELRRRARAALEDWRRRVVRELKAGTACGELVAHDSNAVASTILATIEGAVMLSRVYGDAAHLRAALDHLDAYLDTLVRA